MRTFTPVGPMSLTCSKSTIETGARAFQLPCIHYRSLPSHPFTGFRQCIPSRPLSSSHHVHPHTSNLFAQHPSHSHCNPTSTSLSTAHNMRDDTAKKEITFKFTSEAMPPNLSASPSPSNATCCKARAPSSHCRSATPNSAHCHPPAQPRARTRCQTSAE